MDTILEFTSPETPEQNGQVERSFATLWGRVRAILNHSGVTQDLRDELWAECAATATKLSNIMSRKKGRSPHEEFYGYEAKFSKNLRIFGEIGVKLSKLYGLPEKIANKGNYCLFLGYESNHPHDTFRVLDLKKKSVMLTRNVRWLNKTYGEFFGTEGPKMVENTEFESSDEEICIKQIESEVEKEEEKKKLPPFSMVTRSKALIDNMDDEDSDAEDTEEEGEALMMVKETAGIDPEFFHEAYFHKDPKKRSGWREAIKKELQSMEKCEVWSLIDQKDVPKGRKLIGNRWVFKEKRDGTFRARLVALGYSQVAGVDFSDHFSPVLCDASFRIILLIIQKLNLVAWSLDIETAFLNGDLVEEIYMKVPKGYIENYGSKGAEGKALKLQKSIYGLVQAARQWHRKFEEVILQQGFIKNEIDPCAFLKREGSLFCILCIYVDDGIITGDEQMMKKVIDGLNKVFKVKVQETIKDFLGCEIRENFGEISLGQSRIVEKLMSDNDLSLKKEKWSTPSAPGFFVVRPQNRAEMIDEKSQKWYRSTIGTLLYLVKLSRPDLANPVRELSKVMDGAAPAHEKELKRLVEFTCQTKDKTLKIKADSGEKWTIEAYSDSDFAGDKDGRKSITGYVILICGVPMTWRSKAQPTTALSSTEAEYIALCEAVREVKFVFQLMETFGIVAERPIKIHVDNIGSIFMSKNRSSGDRTKHIDIKYHFIREQIENGLVEVVFVRSEENLADVFTKNLNGESFRFHQSKLLKNEHQEVVNG